MKQQDAQRVLDTIRALNDATGRSPVAREIAEALDGSLTIGQVSYYARKLVRAGLLVAKPKHARGFTPADHCPMCGQKVA